MEQTIPLPNVSAYGSFQNIIAELDFRKAEY